MPLTDAQLQEYADLMADMGLGGQGLISASSCSVEYISCFLDCAIVSKMHYMKQAVMYDAYYTV